MSRLSEADKLRLLEELAAMATSETDPEYRRYLEKFAFYAGLVETEED
nr:hypothetical protein [Actinomadura sp. WMMB 499]